MAIPKRIFINIREGVSDNTLYCFPYAGGNSLSYKPLIKEMSDEWGVTAIEPPRIKTNDNSFFQGIYEMVSYYEEFFIPLKNSNFSLFGHSLGGLVVYLLAQKLENRNIFPSKLIISASNPPSFIEEEVSGMNDEEFEKYIIDIGGVPNKIIEKNLLSYFIPNLKADFLALENFEYKGGDRVKTPVYILNGTNDLKCQHSTIKNWQKYCEKVSLFSVQGGGHMFVNDQTKSVARIMHEILKKEKLEESVDKI
ncbi:thioesterase II family protein [Oceanobacillus oncorhynchi]|uniref:thioesterase II family protein n=1 Tax=Oceanobacillus oncorhynchi TaxID=545501 RepID=UPI001867C958|nr:thioesterase [Oceanobacillus oncorhynchi]